MWLVPPALPPAAGTGAAGQPSVVVTLATSALASGTASKPAVPAAARTVPQPCKDYMDLRTLADLLSMADQYESVETLSEVSEISSALATFRNVVKGMFNSWKTSVGELDKALKGFTAANEASVKDAKLKKKAAETATSGSSNAKRKKGGTIVDTCLDKGSAMVSFNSSVSAWTNASDASKELFESAGMMNMDPYVVTSINVDKLIAEDTDSPVGVALKEFAADFAVSQYRDTSERAMRASLNTDKSDNDANDYLQTELKQYCPKGSVLAPHLIEKTGPLRTELALTNYGMKKGSFHVSLERSSLWTARLTTSGRRTLAVVSVDDVKKYIRAEGFVGKDPKLWLKEATPTGAGQNNSAPFHM